MGRKAQAKKNSKRSESQTRIKEKQTILRKLQQVVIESRRSSSNSDRPLLRHTRSKTREFSPARRDPPPTFGQPATDRSGNKHRDETPATANATTGVDQCYRCKHFLEIPQNLVSRPAFSDALRGTTIGRCELELSFVQAIVWLKSIVARAPGIPSEELQRMLDKLNRGDRRREGERRVETSKRSDRPVRESLLSVVHKETAAGKTLAETLTPLNIPDLLSCDITPRLSFCESHVTHGIARNDKTSSLNDVVDASEMDDESSSQESWPGRVTAKRPCLIAETDVEGSSSSDMFEVPDTEFDGSIGLESEDIAGRSVERSEDESVSLLHSYNRFDRLAASNRHPYANLDETRDDELVSQSDPKDLEITQMDISQVRDDSLDRSPSTASDVGRIEFEIQIDTSVRNQDGTYDAETRTNAVRNPEHDSGYSVSNVNNYTLNRDTTMPVVVEEPDNIIGHRYALRSYRKRAIEKQASTENVVVRATKRVGREASPEREREMISAKWLSFTLESLNVERVILESLRVILWTLVDRRTAEEYASRRHWKGTLQQEAVNAVLNASDVFKMENKSDVCGREIARTVIKALDEITACVRLNNTSVWIYRVQIISELCNSLPICVKIIDHLIKKLRTFKSAVIHATEIQRDAHATINQLHLVFYALNIVLRKYRTVIPGDRKSSYAGTAIPHVADLWKTRSVLEDEEPENTRLDLNAAEERWSSELENFTVAATEHFGQFAEKSQSLLRLLISQ